MYIRPAFNEISLIIAVICIVLLALPAYADTDYDSDEGFVFDEVQPDETDTNLENAETINTDLDNTDLDNTDTDPEDTDLDDTELSDEETYIPEILKVRAPSKRLQPITDVSATVYVLTSKDIARHGWRNLAEILRHIPGIHTQTAESQFQVISINGLLNSSASKPRILWFLNDIPVNDVHSGQVYIDDTFPIDLIGRIEVIMEPTLYGPGAFQGSIHIYTKESSELPKYGQYRLSVENNLTFKGAVTAGYDNPETKFGILGHVSGGTTQGDGLVADSVYQKYLMEQAAESVREGNIPTNIRRSDIENNSQKSWYNLFLSMHYKGFKFDVAFDDIYSHLAGSEIKPFIDYKSIYDYEENQDSDESGVLEKTIPLKSNSRLYRRMLFASLGYQQNFTDWFTFNTQLSYHLIHNRIYDYTGIANTDTNKTNIKSLEHQADYFADFHFNLGDTNTLSTGLAVRYQTIKSDDQGVYQKNNVNTRYDLLTPTVWLRDEQRLWSDRIILMAGARYDAYQAIHKLKHDATWEAGFVGKWHPVFTTRLHYSYAIGEPSFDQLYARRPDYIGKTSDDNDTTKKLFSEKNHNVNVSLDFTPKEWISFSFSGHLSLMKNLIIDEFSKKSLVGIALYHPMQNSHANIYGAEFKMNIIPHRDWMIYGYYHFLYSMRKERTKSSDTITDNRFTDDSMHRAEVGFSYNNEYVGTDLSFFLVSGTPDTISAYNLQKSNEFWRIRYHIPTYFIIQPSVTVKLPAEFGLSINGSYAVSKGLLDSPTYRYYYQKEGVPTNRYSLSFSILYPCQ